MWTEARVLGWRDVLEALLAHDGLKRWWGGAELEPDGDSIVLERSYARRGGETHEIVWLVDIGLRCLQSTLVPAPTSALALAWATPWRLRRNIRPQRQSLIQITLLSLRSFHPGYIFVNSFHLRLQLTLPQRSLSLARNSRILGLPISLCALPADLLTQAFSFVSRSTSAHRLLPYIWLEYKFFLINLFLDLLLYLYVLFFILLPLYHAIIKFNGLLWRRYLCFGGCWIRWVESGFACGSVGLEVQLVLLEYGRVAIALVGGLRDIWDIVEVCSEPSWIEGNCGFEGAVGSLFLLEPVCHLKLLLLLAQLPFSAVLIKLLPPHLLLLWRLIGSLISRAISILHVHLILLPSLSFLRALLCRWHILCGKFDLYTIQACGSLLRFWIE